MLDVQNRLIDAKTDHGDSCCSTRSSPVAISDQLHNSTELHESRMILWRSLLAIIVMDLVSAQDGDSDSQGAPLCAKKGVSYTDPNIVALNGGRPPDAMTCQKACALTASCHFFTFYTDSKGCWLMTDQAKLNEKGEVPSEAFAVSGPKSCPVESVTPKKPAAALPEHQEDLHPDAQAVKRQGDSACGDQLT
eukprot:Skav201371  [mRNA]  locus=scaffold176:405030:408985:- [translate_table: standard]